MVTTPTPRKLAVLFGTALLTSIGFGVAGEQYLASAADSGATNKQSAHPQRSVAPELAPTGAVPPDLDTASPSFSGDLTVGALESMSSIESASVPIAGSSVKAAFEKVVQLSDRRLATTPKILHPSDDESLEVVAAAAENGDVCVATAVGGGCFTGFSDAMPVSVAVAEDGSDSPVVSGVAPDDVARVGVGIHGRFVYLDVQNNSFAFRTPSGTGADDLGEYDVVFVDGSHTIVNE